jgi:hypothetical protein
MIDEIKDQLILLIDEFGDHAIQKLAEKMERAHRGNAIQIIRDWREQLDKMKVKKDGK